MARPDVLKIFAGVLNIFAGVLKIFAGLEDLRRGLEDLRGGLEDIRRGHEKTRKFKWKFGPGGPNFHSDFRRHILRLIAAKGIHT